MSTWAEVSWSPAICVLYSSAISIHAQEGRYEALPNLALRVLFVLVAFALTLAEPASLRAQKRKPVPSPSGKPPAADTTSQPPQLRSADQAQFEMSVLMSRRTLVTDLERERRRLATQLAQDLEQLEQINTEKLVPLSTTASPDYRNLAQASAELKARATRIKFYSPLVLIDKTGEKVRLNRYISSGRCWGSSAARSRNL